MEKISQADELGLTYYPLLDESHAGPIALPPLNTLACGNDLLTSTGVLDRLLALIKWLFLYLPGAFYIHMFLVGMALLIPYRDSTEMVWGTFGVLIVGTFMIMLGLGKLKDLRYLRVAGGIASASLLFAVIYGILMFWMPLSSFPLYALATFPLSLTVGFLVKRHTDVTSA